MLAMCVRKPGDTGGTPTLQSSISATTNGSTSKRTKSRALKSLRAHVAPKQQAQVQPQQPAGPATTTTAHVDVACTVKIRDDVDGHLIYHKGDHVDSRCKLLLTTLLYSMVYGIALVFACICTYCFASVGNFVFMGFS